MKVIITPNPYRDRNLAYATSAQELLRKAGIDAPICLSFDVEHDYMLPRSVELRDLDREISDSDMLICFGGDGTLLHTSKIATAHAVPVLGVNIGTLGFMTELEISELSQLSGIKDGAYSIEERMMLEVEVFREGISVLTEQALNDAAITKGAIARVIQMGVYCDDVEAMCFDGDGVIVATPTGSTAYSMSAGGPIVEPVAENILITPVCAHSIQCRPLVTAGDRRIEIRIGRTGRKNAFLSTDGGRAFRLNSGDVVKIKKSPYKTRLVKLGNKSFYDILNRKLK